MTIGDEFEMMHDSYVGVEIRDVNSIFPKKNNKKKLFFFFSGKRTMQFSTSSTMHQNISSQPIW